MFIWCATTWSASANGRYPERGAPYMGVFHHVAIHSVIGSAFI
uniref:Uncharacterized protein n=1 Tax=Anguilla anguilla TaxID=7936 RepID=A0A0E9THQ5_ANGAN